MEERRYISSETAAQLIGITRRSVNRQIKGGRLQAVATPTTKGGAEGTANSILLEDVLQQLDTQGRLLWYESQSGLSTQVSAADLATYKEAFGEEGLTELANRQQAVMALDGILNSGERGRTAAMDALATLGVTAGRCGVGTRHMRSAGWRRSWTRWSAGTRGRAGRAAVGAGLHRGADVRQSEVSADAGAGAPAGAGSGIRRKRLQLLRVLRRIGRAAGAQNGQTTGRKYPICTMASGSMMIPGESSRGQPHRGNDG